MWAVHPAVWWIRPDKENEANFVQERAQVAVLTFSRRGAVDVQLLDGAAPDAVAESAKMAGL